MKYALKDLQNVRKFRENVAASAVNAAQQQVEQTSAQLEQRKKELEDYIHWRVTQEENLYQVVLRQLVLIKDLDDLRLQIQLMRDDETSYVESVSQAEQAFEEARQTLKHAMDIYRQATKKLKKIDEHERLWKAWSVKETERVGENEMDDFRMQSNREEF